MKCKRSSQARSAKRICISLDSTAADTYINNQKIASKPLKGITKKSTSNAGNDGKKKVEFCPMNLQSTSKTKCDSSDSDPDAVMIVSPPKKVSKSKIKEDKTKNKKSPPSKNT